MIKELKETKTIEEVVGFQASDGTVFSSRDEANKYESTCKCVIMAPYKKLVVNTISEFDFYNQNAGCEDFYYDILIPKTDKDIDVINKALKFAYSGSKVLDETYIGKTVLVYRDYDDALTGGCQTLEEVLDGIKSGVVKALESVGENN